MKKIGLVLVVVASVMLVTSAGIAFVNVAPVVQGSPEIEKIIVAIQADEMPARGGIPGPPEDIPEPPEGEEEGEYRLLKKGLKWRVTPVSYVIDPYNLQGLTQEFIAGAVSASAEEWDSYTSTELFNDTYGIVHDATFDTVVPDGRNEIMFGDYPWPGVVAVTVIWGISNGPPEQREILEFDIMFDTDYAWGDATVLGDAVMDLQNVSTHEFGHGSGLDDVDAEEETMYGVVDYGETMKRTLYFGDKAGIQELYGV